MKKFVVACGSGVATSQTIASAVNRMLERDRLAAKVEAVDMKSLEQHIKGMDGYIYVAKPTKDYGIPIFNGIAFLTGVGKEVEYQKIVEFIKR